MYAINELAVTCNAVIDANDEVANVFNKLTSVEAPQLPESPSIELNLLLIDKLNMVTDDVLAYEPVFPPITSNLELTLLLNEFNEFIEVA